MRLVIWLSHCVERGWDEEAGSAVGVLVLLALSYPVVFRKWTEDAGRVSEAVEVELGFGVCEAVA